MPLDARRLVKPLVVTASLVVVVGVGLRLCSRVHFTDPVHHHVTVTNATEEPLIGFRLAFDNAPFYRDAPPIPAHGTYVFDFERTAETGYVFTVPEAAGRRELGRCGYTETGMNAYEVTISAVGPTGFKCKDVTPDGARWP